MRRTESKQVPFGHEITGRVKITRANGNVEHVDVPAEGIEMYDLGGGVLAPSYPAGTAPRAVRPSGRFRRWFGGLFALGAMQVLLAVWMAMVAAAIVYTDKGQEKTVDVIDPATRGSQVTSYYGAWGSSATAPAVGQTALGTELAEARVLTTISQPAANTIRWLWEVTATGNRTVNEFGVFTASSSGDMWIRGTLSTLNIETGDRVEFTIDLLFKDVTE